MRLLPTVAIAAVAVAVLAGCTGAPADASEPSEAPVTAAASETPTPSPTPTPVDADPANAATWLIDADGVGPFKLGMPLDEAVALMPGYTVETCPNPVVRFLRADSATDPSITLASAADGRLVHVTLHDSTQPATADGIRIGSTVTEAMSAYPGLEFSQRYNDRYTLEGTPGWITFETESVDVGATAPIDTISVVEGAPPQRELCG